MSNVAKQSANPWTNSAARETECLQHYVRACATSGPVAACPASCVCHGTGQVPLIEGLRRPCELCKGMGTRYHSRFGGPPQPGDTYQCPTCGGTGWLPVSGPEAIVAAQEFILSQPAPDDPMNFWNWEVEKDKTVEDDGKIKEWVMVNIRDTWDKVVDGWHFLGISDPQPTYAAALAQALERALKEKP